jgi:iron(III) transport system substrate-binding protein
MKFFGTTGSMSRRRFAKAGAIALAATVATVLSGCGGGPQPAAQPSTSTTAGSSWADTEAAANAEGKVVLYISVPGLEDAITAGFKKAYPKIQLQIVRLASGDLLARIDHEHDAGVDGADVVLHGDTGWFQDHSKDLLPLGPSVDKYWKGSDQVFDGGKYVTSDYLLTQLVSNTDAMKSAGAKPIKTYDDLLQPALKDGLIGLAGPNISSGQAQYWYYLYKIHGKEWFQKLADLHPDIYDNSVTQLIQALGAGSHAAGLFSYATLTQPLLDDGAPIDTLVEEPTIVISHKLGVPSWSKRPEAGEVLANWMLSKEGQIAMYGAGGVASPMPAASLGDDLPKTMIKLPKDPKDLYVTDGVLTDEQQKFLDEVWRPIFNN